MARSDMSDLEWEFIKRVLPNKTGSVANFRVRCDCRVGFSLEGLL